MHSHYWMSARAGRTLAGKLGVPHVMTFHSLGHAKNSTLAKGDLPEPGHRLIGERRAVDAADHIVASTEAEASMLMNHYGACRSRISVIAPGVDTSLFTPKKGGGVRERSGVSNQSHEFTLVVAGRIQPLKGIDIGIAALAELQRDPGSQVASRWWSSEGRAGRAARRKQTDSASWQAGWASPISSISRILYPSEIWSITTGTLTWSWFRPAPNPLGWLRWKHRHLGLR